MPQSDIEKVSALYGQWSGQSCQTCEPLAANGSNRRYYRLGVDGRSVIAAVNPDLRENRAFCYYSRFFHERGICVPELYAVAEDETCYLQEDLGDTTLYQFVQSQKECGQPFGEPVVALYRDVLADLARIQVVGRSADFRHSYPRQAFDRQSIQWDLNYFKYYFLKTSTVAFDEQLLEDDFQLLTDKLLSADCGYFLYRDFQARNVMLVGGRPYYIDYQGGRRGAAQYDVASLLYSAKSELPETLRTSLLEYYIDKLSELEDVDRGEFVDMYYTYVLVRILQTLGAYGFRGMFERKDYFLQSIPFAKANLRRLLSEHPQKEIVYLSDLLMKLTESK